jgi:hypothetical protein
MIEDHVADLHCRSEKYLADETMLEYQGKLGNFDRDRAYNGSVQ